MKDTFDQVSYQCSKIVTKRYSTSFALATKMLHSSIRGHIYNIYGFVRFADEIVDTFHDYDKEILFDKFEEELEASLRDKISLNPILNSFQHTYHTYNIPKHLVDSFMKSMRMDLVKNIYRTDAEYKEYIYGSADVVGLMCLKVFVGGNEEQYQTLKPTAMRLGSAFQKVNFLRDINNDINELHRVYFPILSDNELNEAVKEEIIKDIDEDFRVALEGIKKLPKNSKKGVYAAYLYYSKLTNKIKKSPVEFLLKERIRIPNRVKIWILVSLYISNDPKLK